MMRGCRFLWFWAFLACAAPAFAVQRGPRTVAELGAGAAVIFIGRCEAVTSHWNNEHSLILTASRFRVTRTLKGAPGAVFTVDELGGMVGSRGMTTAGVPHYAVGEEVLLCARRSLLGRWETYGGGRAKLRVVRDARGRPWVRSGFCQAELAAMAPSGAPPGSAPLAVFAGHLLAASNLSNLRREQP